MLHFDAPPPAPADDSDSGIVEGVVAAGPRGEVHPRGYLDILSVAQSLQSQVESGLPATSVVLALKSPNSRDVGR